MAIADRKQREKEKRREEILLAAEKVFFSRGMQFATVDDVAAEAELSKGTIYLYFKNREEIIAAIFSRGMLLLQELMVHGVLSGNTAIDKLQALGKAYLDFACAYPQHFSLMLEKELHNLDADPSKPEAAACFQSGLQLLTMLKMIIIEGVQERSLRTDIDPARVALMIWGQIHGVIAIASNEEKCEHFQQFCSFTLESIVKDTLDIIINGIKNNK